MPKNIPDSGSEGSGDFQEIVNGFLNAPGLPFSNVLTAERIRKVFARHGRLFGEHGIYSTVVVLWAFLSQVLREGKEAACQSAVAQITAHCIQTGIDPPSADTGDYCKGRAKLPEAALHELTCVVAAETETQANEEWLWMKRHTKLVDGFTFTMPATEENLAKYPRPKTQKKGVGLPIAWPLPFCLSLPRLCWTPRSVRPKEKKRANPRCCEHCCHRSRKTTSWCLIAITARL